ncbi:uncharacterized protein A4U43_C05F3130 [Asparagus officinalis]|uniref:Isopenicillin N synthase-like Fe(2+) 2OG dioxygenase domain-containing protein n=1 Tax=Asparagus officinalis TaxID=4686 RepID=A0A5P1ENY6_ASPOF|nr:uncharacterized protein A4U43_C05F3130 [Asparagus officinalis]
MLLQDDDIAGLQIKYKEEWFLVKPIPDALVGDVIEAWSNGIYKSIEHRAITSNKKARMSLATSVIANEVVEIGPLQEMVEGIGRPKMYRTVKYLDYIRHTLGRKMEGKAHTRIFKLDDEDQG